MSLNRNGSCNHPENEDAYNESHSQMYTRLHIKPLEELNSWNFILRALVFRFTEGAENGAGEGIWTPIY